MNACAVHRPRYHRLLRLPVVRTVGVVTGAALAAVAVLCAVVAPPWLLAAVPVVAASALTVYMRRNWARIALEWKLFRALRDSVTGCAGGELPGLDAEVRVATGTDGVARIEAASWPDAVRALGHVVGRDRAFQLDLLRRTAQGRLAEVWGRVVLPVDTLYRPLGLAAAATTAAAALEPPERDLLAAFTDGVNSAFEHHGPPFECRFLSYRPEPWTVADSILIALYLFHTLSWNEMAKRADAVLRAALPADVAAFLLPGDVDVPMPGELARSRSGSSDDGTDLVAVDRIAAGSNCWVARGASGPLLACDPHLPLASPNLLYEVDLRWAGQRLYGLVAPGLPVVLTGGNGRIVWGVTNLTAEVLDLVPCAEEDLTTETELIRVRGGHDERVDVCGVGTAPLSPTPLLGQPVACRWTGHDPRAADLRFQRLAHAANVTEAAATLDDAGGIALNVLVADASGRMAHLAAGLLPRRPATTPWGAPASRADAAPFLAGAERPRIVDPPSGVLVSANDAALPDTPYRIGYDLDPGHRARRAREVLAATPNPDLAAMRALQHDTAVAIYEPYRALAVEALAGTSTGELLAGWTGRSDVDSRAFAVLVRLREILARRVLAPYLAPCRELDPRFVYPFRSVDRPVLAILHAAEPALLPDDAEPREFVARCAEQAVAEVAGARWGEINSVGLRHPLTSLAPWAAPLLDIPALPQPGAVHAVRACAPGFGAAARAVLGPDGTADFEMPGGQSGHPLSPRFADRHRGWAGRARPARRLRHCTTVLSPARAARSRASAATAAAGRS